MRPHPFIRVTSASLLVCYLNLALPVAPLLWAAQPEARPITLDLEPLPRDWAGKQPLRPPAEFLETVRTPENVAVNRTVPATSQPDPTPRFSEQPTIAEIKRVRIFREELQPVTEDSSPTELKALADAIVSHGSRKDSDDTSALTGFLQAYPKSPWKISLLTNIGLAQFDAGYFSKAFATWEDALHEAKQDNNKAAGLIAGRALAELLTLNARVGRMEKMEELLVAKEVPELVGPLAERVRSSRGALGMMKTQPEIAFKCGPFAVGNLLQAKGQATSEKMQKVHDLDSTTRGTSLFQVNQLAEDTGLSYQMAFRNPGAALPVPAVVHWKVGHFAAIVAEPSPGRYLIKDPTFGQDLTIGSAALDAEASGYFLIPSGALPAGWTAVDAADARKVFGRGLINVQKPDKLGPDQQTVNPKGPCGGMPVYNVHAMLVSLTINDMPVGYQPAVGPAVTFQITHLQKASALATNVSNLGLTWTHNWLSYVELTSATDAKVFLRGGGVDYFGNFNSTTNKYDLEMQNRTELAKVGATYELTQPDGSKTIYGLFDGTRYLLTQVKDPWNNTVTVNYDGAYRISSITDALGQVTTFSYQHATDTRKITKVTDPYGRFATFGYRSDLLLETVTDVIGLTSTFTYQNSAPKYLTAMTTPYGTTSFAYDLNITPDSNNLNTSVEVTLPDGSKECTWFKAQVAAAAIPDNSDARPGAAYADQNPYLIYRNTFYWGRKAHYESIQATGSLSESKAVIYHWLHDSGVLSSILESVKQPNETRVWFTYPNQTNPIHVNSGMLGLPKSAARMAEVFDPPTNTTSTVAQVSLYEYNALGRVTKTTDPLGRVTTFDYATNLQDLLFIKQKNSLTAETYDTLASFLYAGPAHLPTTVTDAAGQSTQFAYHANGQLKTVTNAKSELTTLYYDPAGNPDNATASSTGYLVKVDGPLAGTGDTVKLAYDTLRRPRTFTDTDNYAVTTDYDNLDRPTVITYPDGTFEQIAYPRLEAEWMRDRLGRWTQVGYNNLRQVSFVQDSMQRVTSYQWCYCGALQQLTDPLGRVTNWAYNFAGQLTQKTYPGGGAITYTYDSAGRLKDVTDALSQKTNYKYLKDGALGKVEYTGEINATADVSFTYDTIYPRPAAMTDGLGATSYGYHPVSSSQLGAGQLASVDGPFANDTVTYTYDELGRTLTRKINGAANSTGLTYDAAGRVTQIVNPLGTFGFGYVNATDRLDYVNYPNAQRTNYAYYPKETAAPGAGNGDFRLQQIQNLKTAGGLNLSTFAYTYDTAGIISTWTQQAGTNPSQTYTFGYDLADQLRTALLRNTTTGASLHANTYAYDDAGNRTSDLTDATPRTFTINNLNQIGSQSATGPVRFSGTLSKPGTATVAGAPATMDGTTRFSASPILNPGAQNVPVTATDTSGNVRNQTYALTVGNAGSRSFAYDANGNMTNNGAGQTYAWDAADRLIKITYTGGATTEFVYNGASQRVKIIEKNSGGTVTSEKRFVWCDEPQPCEERDASDNVTKRFYSGLGQMIGSTKYFYTTDHLGSIRELTDFDGVVRARYDYDPYGRTTKTSGDLESDFGYTGFYRHQGSGLGLTLYRAYDTDLGRWLSRDPIYETGGSNLYSYCLGNPLTAVDPFGLKGVVRLVGTPDFGRTGRGIVAEINANGYLSKRGVKAELVTVTTREQLWKALRGADAYSVQFHQGHDESGDNKWNGLQFLGWKEGHEGERGYEVYTSIDELLDFKTENRLALKYNTCGKYQQGQKPAPGDEDDGRRKWRQNSIDLAMDLAK